MTRFIPLILYLAPSGSREEGATFNPNRRILSMFRDGAITLSLVIAIISVTRIPFRFGEAPGIPADFCISGNREDLMVCGRPLRVEQDCQPEIELIPGMSPNLAQRLIASRDDVFLEFDRTGSIEKGLEKVRGIGKKRAEKFAPFLSLY